ncbi:MAG: hypothetical protein GXX96_02020 [Planctomycetaceae bacterium]|nr:hypothetical protein [Planctomycetaceae bacterium]
MPDLVALNTKIGRLRRLLFGARTEKTKTVVGDKAKGSTAASSDEESSQSSEEGNPKEGFRPPPKGQGNLPLLITRIRKGTRAGVKLGTT